MVIVDGISKKGQANKGGLMSFFSRFAGSRKAHIKTPTIIAEITKKDVSQSLDARPTSMTLKLSTPSSPQAEEPTQLLTDILMNEQLFEVFHGKSLILQAEVTVEKQLDGSPKSMIVSGQVPVTLSKGYKNGKPTREIRVRGHLRRKRSNELGATNAPDRLNSSDQLGVKPSLDWEAEDKYGLADRNMQQHGWKKTHNDPPLRPLEPAEFQTSPPFRTYSNLGASQMEKNNLGPWTAGESGHLDQRPSSENNLQENPTGIANWSPYFDCGSPMSGRTVRGNCRQFQANWDLRENTPTPRFSSSMGRGNHPLSPLKEGRETTSTQKSPINNIRRGDWTPYIGINPSSTSNPTFTKTELLRNKSLDLNILKNGEKRKSNLNATRPGAEGSPIRPGPVSTTRQEEQREKTEIDDRRWNPRVNRCLLVEENHTTLVEDKEDDNGRCFDEMGLSVARSESIANDLKEGKLRVCCKEDTFSTDSGPDLSVHNLHDDATQTNGRRRIEISKISHQVGEKLNHLKEMVMRHPENPNNDNRGKRILSKILPKKFSKSNEYLAHDRHDNNHSSLHGKHLDHSTPQPFKGQDKQHGAEEALHVTEHAHSKSSSPKSVQERAVPVKSGSLGTTDHRYTSGSQGNDDFCSKINREMLDKLVQARGSSIDKYNHITSSIVDDHTGEKTSDPGKVRELVYDRSNLHDKYNLHQNTPISTFNRETESKLVQATGSSIDKYPHITRNNGGHARGRLGEPEKIGKHVNGNSKKTINTFNRQMESKLVQARESSIDQYLPITRSNGDHALQRLGDKAPKLVHGSSDSHDKYVHTKDKPIDKCYLETESNLVQVGSSIDKYPRVTWSTGDHTSGKSSDLQKEQKLIQTRSDTRIYTQDKPQHKYEEEVENHWVNSVHAGGSSTDKYPHTTWTIGDHARKKLGDLEKKVQNLVHDLKDSQKMYGHAQGKPNLSCDHPQGKPENTFSPTHDQSDTKQLNPITTITISRSRTRFIRYNNGHHYQEKAGAQVVTIEAPKGLFYSSTQSH